MNLTRRILVVHPDALARRRLLLVLIEAGYDVRACVAAEAALDVAASEWFDLVLVDYALPGGDGFAFGARLRQAQPSVPVIMLLPALELPLIVEGIRQGLTDVLPAEDDPRPMLRRINALLRADGAEAAAGELTPEELAAAEGVLDRLGGGAAALDPADAPPDLRGILVDATKERADLELRLERALQEKAAVEAELHSLLTRNTDAARLQAEAAQLHSQRELAAAAQDAIDAKARQLAETRAAIAAERKQLEEAKREEVAPVPVDRSLVLEKSHLDALREDLKEEEARLTEEAARVRQEATQLAQERRRWQEEMEELREREENLQGYEKRLREMQAQIEAERVQRAPLPAKVKVNDLIEHDQKIRAEWEKIQRANQVLEAERAVFRDERMALRDLEKTIKTREERLREVESQLRALEVIRRHGGPTSKGAARGTENPSASGKTGGMLKALARSSLWHKGES